MNGEAHKEIHNNRIKTGIIEGMIGNDGRYIAWSFRINFF
jgi:hypothetical protein